MNLESASGVQIPSPEAHLRSRKATFLRSLFCIVVGSTPLGVLGDTTLFSTTGSWRYNQTTNLDGLSWFAPNYDDSAWSAGAGLLFAETNTLVSPRVTPLSPGRTTYYFRARVIVPVVPSNAIMAFNCRVDDGAVFYLNGSEIQRLRMPVPPTQISYADFATGTPPGGDTTSAEVFTLSGAALTNFIVGTNLLAVEVHQESAASDDIVFGTSVVMQFSNSPPIFLRQPADTNVVEGRPVSLTAQVDGSSPLSRQWFKDGSLVIGATNSALTFSSAALTNSGTYWLEVNNAFGPATSSNAVLAVLPDTVPPIVTSALALKNLTNISLTFSEPISPASAGIVSNYQLFQTTVPSNGCVIVGASVQNSTNVLLTTTPRIPGLNYSLRVGGVADLSAASNAIPQGMPVPLAYQVDLVKLDETSPWRFYQLGQLPVSNWMASSFNDSAWPVGVPIFFGGSPPLVTQDPARTTLALTNPAGSGSVTTYYFRTRFDLPGPLATNQLFLRQVVDDGVAYYLNGSEIYSIGVPSTRPLSYSSFSTRSIGTATYEPPLTNSGTALTVTNLTIFSNMFAAEVHQWIFGLGDVAFGAAMETVVTQFDPRPTLVLPTSVTEGSGILTNQGMVFLREAFPTNVEIQLGSGSTTDLSVPPSVTILAGATNAFFEITVTDDTILTGPRSVTVQAGPMGNWTTSTTVTVLDDETTTIALLAPAAVSEGLSNFVAEVRFGQPLSNAVTVLLTSSNTTELTVPSMVTMPAGVTSAVFNVSVVNDSLVDGPQLVTLAATVAGWPAGSANVVVNDNESTALNLSLPASVIEGSGTLMATGRVWLGGIAVTDVVVVVAADLPGYLGVPATVTIPAGTSNALFDVTVPDNALAEGSRPFTVSCTAAGFMATNRTVTVLDNDPHHFVFGVIAQVQNTNAPFSVTIRAADPSGNTVAGFTNTVSLAAVAVEGALAVTPSSVGPFVNGQWSGNINVTTVGTLVRLSIPSFAGESNPFHVEPPVLRVLSQSASDLAWDQASGTLFASVPPGGGIYSNRIIAVDPVALAVIDSYPIGDDPRQIELSPAGRFLYVAVSNRSALRRFDMDIRQAGTVFGSLGFVSDFTVLGGPTNSLVASRSDTAGNNAGVWRYDSGIGTLLANFGPAVWLESAPSGEVLFSEWLRGVATPSSLVLVASLPFSGSQIIHRDGVLYGNGGHAVDANTLVLLGVCPGISSSFPDISWVEVDPDVHRTIFLTGRSGFGGQWRLRAFDRDNFQLLAELNLGSISGGAGRVVRCGTNGLAFSTGSGQIWFVRSGALQPSRPPADLAITQSAASLPPLVGSNLTITLSVSNAGPGMATFVRVSNSPPPNASVVGWSNSVGAVTLAGGVLTWSFDRLDAGSNAVMQFTVRMGDAGWLTNRAIVSTYEPDLVSSNNASVLELYGQVPPLADGVFRIQLGAEDLLYDPVRDRLLVSVADGHGGQTNGLTILNPHTAASESFIPLVQRPARLVRPQEGQYLYISLKDDGLVRRLDLATLSSNLDFTLGGDVINGGWYPYYAADMATVPGLPTALAVWRVRHAGPQAGEYGSGVAVFDNGTMRSNTTPFGGNWSVEFDTDAGTMFAFQSGTTPFGGAVRSLNRCMLDANGVTIVETYPMLDPSVGTDLDFAAGQFFTTAGRSLRTQPFGVTGIYSGSGSAILVEPDAANDRVFFLSTVSGEAVIKAYEMESFNLLGTVVVSNIVGTPDKLIRWGTNGLAFRTTGGQVFLIRTPFVVPGSGADLRVTLAGPAVPVPAGQDATFLLSITNRGPQPAVGLVVTNSFSAAVQVASMSNSIGTFLTTNSALVWSIPQFDAGGICVAAFSVRPAQTSGVLSVSARLSAATPDPAPGDNSALALLRIGGNLEAEGVCVLAVGAQDLAWSSSLGRILLSSTTNDPNWNGALLSLDPSSFDMRYEMTLGAGAGKLAMSDDGSRLFAALDLAVAEASVPAMTKERRFVLGLLGEPIQAVDLRVLPGSTESLGVLRVSGGYGASVAVFDRGVVRTNIAPSQDDTYGEVMEIGADATRLYVQNQGVGGFRRYQVDAQGVTFLDADTTLFPVLQPVTLEHGGGRLYGSTGKVIDPLTRQLLGTIAGVPANALVRFDESTARVFYLVPSGATAQLQAYDGATLASIGGRTITGLSGTPDSFIRWGGDGLAFRTTGGQVFVLRTSLLPTNPPADLSVALTQSAPPHVVGSNVVATILITNQGPNTAIDLVWSNTLPAGAGVVSAMASQGTVSLVSNIVSGQMPLLASGAVATVTVTFQPATAGLVTNQVRVSSTAIDQVYSNNSAAVLFWVQAQGGIPPVISLDATVKDIISDPVRPLIYASFGSGAGLLADTIVAIDPVNGGLSAPLHVGSDPGQLAVSGGGEFLYVGLDGAGTVKKIALSNFAGAGGFPVPQNYVVSRMAVAPNDPERVVIRREPGSVVSMHQGGIKRPNEVSGVDFAFSDVNSELYACNGFYIDVPLYRVDTGAAGLALVDPQPAKQDITTDIKFSGGLLFFNRGMVVNPETRRVVAIMPVPYNSLVQPDANSGRVFYLTPSSVWTLRAFDMAQAVEVGALALPAITGTPTQLVRWGNDGFAVCSTSGQVTFIRGALLPAGTPADLSLGQFASLSSVTTTQNISFTLSLTNLGPGGAAGVVVTQAFSSPVTNVVLTPTSGTAGYTNGVVTWLPGPLGTGAVAALTVTVRPLQTGALAANATARHEANDPLLANNAALSVINVIGGATSNILQFRLPTRELVYDPLRGVLYASLTASAGFPGNCVSVIDPATGSILRSFFVGSEPNQLALSGDSRFLYVSLNGTMGIRRIDLEGQVPDLEFAMSLEELFNALDLKVPPGLPLSVAVSRVSTRTSGYPESVALYDNEVVRPLRDGRSNPIEFSPDGAQIYGSTTFGVGYGFLRMLLTPDGVNVVDQTAAYGGDDDVRFANGLIFGTTGQVIDPNMPVRLGIIPATGPVCPDSDAGRVFYLSQASTNWELRAYQIGSTQLIGTVSIPGVTGTPGSLLRCGADRFAFRTSSDQVFIVRTPLVPVTALAATDLAVSQTAVQDFTVPTETIRFTVVVTNRGTAAASNITVAILTPTPVASLAVQSSQGSITNLDGTVVCRLGDMPAGQAVAITVTATITNTAMFTNFVSVTSATRDPDLSNNTSIATLLGVWFQRGDTVRRVSLQTRDLAYDRIRRRLFASVAEATGPNRLVWVDPETGTLDGSINLDAAPDRLAVTDDGQYLYLTSVSTSLVQRVNLQSSMVDFSFSIPATGAPTVMLPVPGQPHALAVVYATSNDTVIAVFDDGVARSNRVTGVPATLLAVAPGGTTLFGYAHAGGGSPRINRMTVDAAGVYYLDTGPTEVPFVSNADVTYAANRLYFGSGDVINPAGWAQEPSFPRFNFGQLVEIDAAPGRAIYLAPGTYSDAVLGIFDLTSRQQLLVTNLDAIYGGIGSLTLCDADRVAFRTGDQIVLLRNSTVPTADLVVTGSFPAGPLLAGAPMSFQLIVSNTGPYAANGVVFTNGIPPDAELLSATASSGMLSTNAQGLTLSAGTLSPGAMLTLLVTLRPTNSTDSTINLSAMALAASPADALLHDNSLLITVTVLADNDRDGLPDQWEIRYGLNPVDPTDALIDSDGDGHSNLSEFLAGTDPRDQASVLRITGLSLDGSNANLSFTTVVGKTYQIETATNLLSLTWFPLISGISGTGISISNTISNVAPASMGRYMRVRLVP